MKRFLNNREKANLTGGNDESEALELYSFSSSVELPLNVARLFLANFELVSFISVLFIQRYELSIYSS